MMATTGDYLKLHFIVFLWGFTAILGKLITIPSVEMVFYRCLLATVGIFFVILYFRTNFQIDKTDIIRLLLTGAIVSVHWISFFGSARVSNVSVSLVGFATASLWTSIIEPLSLGRKIKPMEVFLGSFVIVGIPSRKPSLY
jgi:drug/metabolite transporter (DMT)-like permease